MRSNKGGATGKSDLRNTFTALALYSNPLIQNERGSALLMVTIGEVVILKSGGPRMTVDEFDDDVDTVHCHWFVDGQKKLESGTFPAGSVEHAGTGGSLSEM